MKKIMFAVVAFAALTFTACGGNKTSDAATEADSAAVEEVGAETASIDDPATATAETASAAATAIVKELEAALNGAAEDPSVVDAAMAKVQETVQQLQAAGNTEAASAYASKVQEFVSTNTEKLKNSTAATTVSGLLTSAISGSSTVNDAASDAVDAVKADASGLKENAKAAVDEKVSEAKGKVSEAKENAKTKVNEKVNEAASKAATKTNEAVQKGLGKVLGN